MMCLNSRRTAAAAARLYPWSPPSLVFLWSGIAYANRIARIDTPSETDLVRITARDGSVIPTEAICAPTILIPQENALRGVVPGFGMPFHRSLPRMLSVNRILLLFATSFATARTLSSCSNHLILLNSPSNISFPTVGPYWSILVTIEAWGQVSTPLMTSS